MKIAVIGTGYVGLVVGACLADMGNDIICVDKDSHKIDLLNQGVIPIYEPGLEEIIKANEAEGRLVYTTDIENTIKEALVCLIAVGTPQSEDGACDLSYVYEVARIIGKNTTDYKVVVNKSTVPVGTAEAVKAIMKEETNAEFDVVSNPEFLSQGRAVEDFLKPDRVIIGADSQRAFEIMKELYSPFLRTGNPIITMDVKSAEMTKYVANSFLATKISFINEMANLCEKVGADIEQVRIGISSDRRIGPQFLFPGIGYGGSCLPKDVKALLKTARDYNYPSKLLESVNNTNQKQRQVFLDKITAYYNGQLSGKTFAVWGLSFKPKTNDMREAPSITVINYLLDQGANIHAFDPKATDEAKRFFEDKISYFTNNYKSLEGTDGLIILTEWHEFRRPDFERIKQLLRIPVIFDGRNLFDSERMLKRGFHYFSIGKKALLPENVLLG